MLTSAVLKDAPTGFSLIQDRKIRFRPLQMCDLPLMQLWLNRTFVSRWFGGGHPTYEDVSARYGPRVRGEVPLDPYLMLYDDVAIGYIQTYHLADHPGYNGLVRAGPNTAGVDLFIGEQNYLHVGFGTAMLRVFLDRVIFADLQVWRCITGADVRNRAALRCFEKVGFGFWKLVNVPTKPRAICFMGIGRQAFV